MTDERLACARAAFSLAESFCRAEIVLDQAETAWQKRESEQGYIDRASQIIEDAAGRISLVGELCSAVNTKETYSALLDLADRIKKLKIGEDNVVGEIHRIKKVYLRRDP